MKLFYIFPHPDDESFGPGPGMHAQRRAGHEVHLLTLTKGGATSIRHELGLSVDEMGEVRQREMEAMAKVLNLAELTVLDLPDNGLKDMDPRILEATITEHLEQLRPEIVITYPVHGISGFADHLVTHAAVRRLYHSMRDGGADWWKRLAFYTIRPPEAQQGKHRLTGSKEPEIDCVYEVGEEDLQAGLRALDCYETYAGMIVATGIKQKLSRTLCYELYQEAHDPPLTDLTHW